MLASQRSSRTNASGTAPSDAVPARYSAVTSARSAPASRESQAHAGTARASSARRAGQRAFGRARPAAVTPLASAGQRANSAYPRSAVAIRVLALCSVRTWVASS
jgi:hypothetical protein